MEKNKTAVEWFNEEINKLNVGNDARVFIAKLFEQAKEMEKEQIRKSYCDGELHYASKQIRTSEQYYNQTYRDESKTN
jgi:hypothetical protein